MKALLRAMVCLTILCLVVVTRPDTAVVAGPLLQEFVNPDQPQILENARLVPEVPGNPQRVVAILPGGRFMEWHPDDVTLLRGSLDDAAREWLAELQETSQQPPPASLANAPASEILVLNNDDSGAGSLRWAIDQANANPGPDIIYFSTSLNGDTISPLSDLPALTDDGTTIDASGNWQGDWPGGEPGITINGSQIATYSFGLQIYGGSYVTIKGLAVENFNTCIWIGAGGFNTIGEGASSFGGGRMLIRGCQGPAVYIIASHDNRVIGSYIGTSNYGNLPEPNLGDGVTVMESPRNAIGDDGPLEGNIIGASDYGIRILGTESISNTVAANQIGVGMLDGNIANVNDGVYIGGKATFTAVGGIILTLDPYTIGVGCSDNGNDIRNNGGRGVAITDVGSSYNGVLSNRIDDNLGHGVFITNGATWDWVMCNTIVRNHQSGVFTNLSGTNSHDIMYNLIGTDGYGTTGLGNGHHGVALYDGTSYNSVYYNSIGGNGWSGVAVIGSSTSNNFMYRNWIGVDVDLFGTWEEVSPMGNGFFGVVIGDSPDNRVGVNTIAYNGSAGGSAGVRIGGVTAVSNEISENSIYSNAGLGIEIVDQAQNQIQAPRILSGSCASVYGDNAPAGGRVEVFSDDADEGRTYEGYAIADSMGYWVFGGEYDGPNLTATVTYPLPGGDTSAFSIPAYGVGACRSVYLPNVLR